MTTAPTDPLTAARAEALFITELPAGSHPTHDEVTAAVRAHGGTRGRATALAGQYGEQPETAIPRMRWALAVIHTAYPKSAATRKARGMHWSAHPAQGLCTTLAH
jgi:hypothetical protein